MHEMAVVSLRFAIVIAIFVCTGEFRDLQKSSFLANEVRVLKKSTLGPSRLWKMEGKWKERVVQKEEGGGPGEGGRFMDVMREKALEKLQEVFGVPGGVRSTLRENLRRKNRKEVPPLFMTELYKEVADPYNGVSRGAKPFGADVIRSYIERGSSHSDLLIFNISGFPPTEHVVEAEIHLYRMGSTTSVQYGSGYNKSSPPYYLIRVYQVLSDDSSLPVDSHRLLSVQHVSDISSSGWHVLNVREAVLDWIKGSRPNLGLIVTVSSPTDGGERRHTKSEVRISRRNEHHNSRQPILVLFNAEETKWRESDNRLVLRHPSRGYPNYYKRTHYNDEKEQLSESEESRTSRHPEQMKSDNNTKGSSSTSFAASAKECLRRDFFVNFEDIGWASWIISPKGFNSHHCQGHCDFPISKAQNPTNHATVQSIVHQLRLVPGIKKPCCVPSCLLPLSILYFDGSDNVVLKMFEDMVVESCGCH